jgi:hypothetical protein
LLAGAVDTTTAVAVVASLLKDLASIESAGGDRSASKTR